MRERELANQSLAQDALSAREPGESLYGICECGKWKQYLYSQKELPDPTKVALAC